MTPPSSAVRHTTTASVVVVAGVAAVVSYAHMAQLAARAGEDWRSWLIPISVDGLVVAASMVLLTRRRAGLAGGALAWGALAVGVLASLAANMADARPEVTAVLVAGWAPVAFAIGFELLLQQRRADRAAAGEITSEPASVASSAPTDGAGLVVSHQPASPVLPSSPGVPPAVTSTPPAPPPEPASITSRVRPLVAEGLGRSAIARRLEITEHQARQAMAEIKTERPALRAVANGRK